MWYDATSAAGSLEAADSPVRGKIGYAAAPVVKTDELRLALRLVVGHPGGQQKKDQAWKFISWASGKEYEQLVGEQLGWSRVPRASAPRPTRTPTTWRRPAPSPSPTRSAIETADPGNPGVQPRPAIGIQFVDIPEFPDLGTQVTQDVSSAIAGQTSVDEALDTGQELAEDVAERYPGEGEPVSTATQTRRIRRPAVTPSDGAHLAQGGRLGPARRRCCPP